MSYHLNYARDRKVTYCNECKGVSTLSRTPRYNWTHTFLISLGCVVLTAILMKTLK